MDTDQKQPDAQDPISYQEEVSKMMTGFGDFSKPNRDTVQLVEGITRNQMRLAIKEALKYERGDGSQLRGESLVFLMRKNKYKMQRFIKSLMHRAYESEAQSGSGGGAKKHPLIEFIEYIDETGELTDLNDYDEVKVLRMIRADSISTALDTDNYLEFYKARCASFANNRISGNLEKFNKWVDPKNEITITKEALEVLRYFAYETVAQLVDYSLLVRMDQSRKLDPLSNLQGMHCSVTMSTGDLRTRYDNPVDPMSNPIVYDYIAFPPISPSEIKEVMRRVYMPQAGKLNFGKLLPPTHHILAI